MTNLVVDIGNSSVKASFVIGTSLGEVIRFEGEDVISFIAALTENRKPNVMAISSVRKLSQNFLNSAEQMCDKLVVVNQETKLLMANRHATPATLGSDRLMAAYGAKSLFPGKSCIIFDFGTALTIDFVSEKNEFSGGNISLGMRSRFKALNDYTQQLPLVDTPIDFVSPGGSTKEAIESGVILGLIFEIEGYMKANPEHIYIFTGGDAIYFAKKLKSSIFVVYNLVLMGLARVAEYYAKS